MGQRLALLSVTDKSGIADFARELIELGFTLVSSGGTAKTIRDQGMAVTEVGDYTGSPEILGGRVKTLHPKVHGGILARLNHEQDLADLKQHDLAPFELVVVNLYRFEEALAKFEAQAPDCCDLEHPDVLSVLEEIDIGGPTMVRAAAKNSPHVGVVVDPADYSSVVTELRSADQLGGATRARLAAKAFRRIAEYDMAVDAFFTRYLSGESASELSTQAAAILDGELPAAVKSAWDAGKPPKSVLRYGENPHQKAFFLKGKDPHEASVLHADLLSGKAISYNNYLDAEAALNIVKEFEETACVVIKHANPCGASVSDSLVTAFQQAKAGDPVSAFGGILAINRPVTDELAAAIAVKEAFFEVLVAPEISDSALTKLTTGAAWGKSLRVLQCGPLQRDKDQRAQWTLRALVGGVLVQQRDLKDTFALDVVTEAKLSAAQERDLQFAWKIVKHVHSNAIVFAKDGTLLGTGAGQMSRVDSVGLAHKKAGERATGGVMASDAFFPFRDGIDAAAKAGITAVIQPGGSRRDQEIIDACNEHGMAMAFTGHRHFLH